jgi:transcriptional regulator with XRE-family HTH domain
MSATAPPVGTLLRDWRTRRRMSQLDLASDAGVSSRHLSFVETGRSRPSREMVLHLAEHLDVPLRARNALLIAAGYAPTYHATDLDATEMQTVRAAIGRVLEGHEPFPAILVDRRWELVAANNAAALLTDGVKPELLDPPCNVLRASLHPDGLGSRIVNLDEWAENIIGGLRRQIAVTGDEELRDLEQELAGYVVEQGATVPAPSESPGAIAIPLRLQTPDGELAFITTIATFGTPLDVTLAELALEAFLPADAATANVLFAKYG